MDRSHRPLSLRARRGRTFTAAEDALLGAIMGRELAAKLGSNPKSSRVCLFVWFMDCMIVAGIANPLSESVKGCVYVARKHDPPSNTHP